MSNIRVKLNTNNRIKVRVGSQNKIKALPVSFNDILDFDDTNKYDKYVIMYDAESDKYTLVNPDLLLNAAAVDETLSPGLPDEFVNQLDNKIDIDAGEF